MGGRTGRSGFNSGGGAKIGVDGTDISQSWSPPPGQSDDRGFTKVPFTNADGNEVFPIEDVIHRQGFDGLPTVLSGEDFDKAVKESGIIAQRGYNAENQKTLDKYHDDLLNGNFYVRCEGGALYGRGMYAAANFDGKLSDETKEAVKRYASSNLQRTHGRVETFTLAPGAKIANYDDVSKQFRNPEMMTKFTNDIGAFAAAMGFDAMRVEDTIVVFNRSKVVVKGD